ncbi:hypothetical protein [Carnimonas nigrificans]|uniref:hypothetical protein n=1 Tax=Carnimonas nigrificans TaxID=64323 RepID=UPI0012EC14A7|nr:hypothetical protein [Carnimonas nigrificans]
MHSVQPVLMQSAAAAKTVCFQPDAQRSIHERRKHLYGVKTETQNTLHCAEKRRNRHFRQRLAIFVFRRSGELRYRTKFIYISRRFLTFCKEFAKGRSV